MPKITLGEWKYRNATKATVIFTERKTHLYPVLSVNEEGDIRPSKKLKKY